MDRELVPGTFARVEHRELGFTTAALWARLDMLAGRVGVRELGFRDLGTATGPIELPAITSLVADMRSEYQVNLLMPIQEVGPPAPPPLGAVRRGALRGSSSGVVERRGHREGRLIVLSGARAIDEYSTARAFLLTCWAAVIPLVIYAFDTGTGTRRPPPP